MNPTLQGGGHPRGYERLGRELEQMALANDADPDRIASWLDCAARSTASESGRCRHIRDIAADVVAGFVNVHRRQAGPG